MRERRALVHQRSRKRPPPGGGLVGPEELKLLPQEVAAHGPEVVAHEIDQPRPLLVREVVRPLEQQPARTGQDRRAALGLERPGFLGADFIDGLVHMDHDVEAIQDVQGVAGLLGHDPQDRVDAGAPALASGGLSTAFAVGLSPARIAHVSSAPLRVGSRTGAVPIGSPWLYPPFPASCPFRFAMGPSPAPASSNPACQFLAPGFPARFAPRVMQPIDQTCFQAGHLYCTR